MDWVLLRDATRTLTKAIDCIRRHGLKNRIKEPMEFRSQMNRYCISMTQVTRNKDSKKKRKEILRQMKKLTKCVEKHGWRYRDLLKRDWEKTDLSKKQAEQIIRRIDNILEQLPTAIDQAHERIIGGRAFANEDKILSYYEPQTQVYHRGKSGGETEFGLQLLIGESAKGLIVDYDLVEGTPKNDTQHVIPCVERLQKTGITISNLVGDRGFVSQANNKYLKKEKIGDHLCPKNVTDLKQKQNENNFIKFQKRRAQTEGRIGILKNNFFGSNLPVKGITRQKKHIAMCILSHNIWLLARTLSQKKTKLKKVA